MAAKRLGISVSVLKVLRGSGIYEVKHLLPTRAGFHELDLNLFTEKMLDLVPNQEPSRIRGRETVTLQSVLSGRRDSLEIKLRLVRVILSGEIGVLSNSDGTVGGLVIDRGAYEQVVADVKAAAAGNIENGSEAAAMLSCSADPIHGLVDSAPYDRELQRLA